MPNDDDKIWQAYTKGVKRISKSAPPKKTERGEREISKPLAHPPRIFSAPKVEKIRVLPQREGALMSTAVFDRATERRLREGTLTLDARIDLHGMTQAEAHAALARFIAAQAKAGHCNLLIITGKGKGNQGVLRTNLAGWLEDLPEAKHINTLRTAAPRHGGAGAFYVIMKRRKDKNAE
jgi:DNA-nicking Smr family endonuclease